MKEEYKTKRERLEELLKKIGIDRKFWFSSTLLFKKLTGIHSPTNDVYLDVQEAKDIVKEICSYV